MEVPLYMKRSLASPYSFPVALDEHYLSSTGTITVHTQTSLCIVGDNVMFINKLNVLSNGPLTEAVYSHSGICTNTAFPFM